MSAKPVEVTDSEFDQEVIKSGTPVLVDFWAPWCGPCKMIGPILEGVAASLQDAIKIYKMNVDENPITAQTYDIRSIPTLILFKQGNPAARMVGVRPQEVIEQEIRAAIQ